MPQVLVTTLRPASGGFGEWDWVEAAEVEGCETFADYETFLNDHAGADLAGRWEVTDALAGLIHNERGQVYRIGNPLADSDRRNGLKDGDLDTFEMAWIEDQDL